MPNEAACFPVTQIPPDGRSAGYRSLLSLCARLAAFRVKIKASLNADGLREGRGEHPPERDSIVSYSPASNFAMASRNASP